VCHACQLQLQLDLLLLLGLWRERLHLPVLRHDGDAQPVYICRQEEAPETLLEDCGHPRHASLHLRVTPISGCEGFERAVVS
jgi:hypothetical protein